MGQMEPCLAQLTTYISELDLRDGSYSVGASKDVIHYSFFRFTRPLNSWGLGRARNGRDGGV